MEAVIRDGRIVAAYVANDLGGAWSRDDFGNYDFPCQPGGERQRELAFRMGVNLVMYGLCLDYKADQVHAVHHEAAAVEARRRRADAAEGLGPGIRGRG
jgi:hypothetical protein